MFSSILPIAGKIQKAGRARTPRPVSELGVSGSLQLFDDRSVCMAPRLLAREGLHLSQRGKRIIGPDLIGITERPFDYF